jgi:hypothetical protein
MFPMPGGALQIVIQGFLEHRFLPGKSVALDGFYKYRDEAVAPMSSEDFWKFDYGETRRQTDVPQFPKTTDVLIREESSLAKAEKPR